MYHLGVFLFGLTAVVLQVVAIEDSKVVNTDLGDVRGNILETILNKRPFHAFRGIRYGKAPIGALRFKPPQSPEPWNDVQDALAYGNVCSQLTLKNKNYVGQEDCLFVNVFSPDIAPAKPLPVIIAIHGGAFHAGSGDWLGPEFLLDEDIILVTFNYRIGAFGFLSLGNAEYSGNNGLKDQLLALKWVNRNIQQFGGDASKITLYGHSAGACAAHFHLLSSQSKGLFQRVILGSGSALHKWAFNSRGNNIDEVKQLLLADGLSIASDSDLNQYLANVDAQVLAEGAIQHFYVAGTNTKEVNITWAPVVEVPEATEPFLLDSPEHLLLKQSPQSNVDTLFGHTNSEALIVLYKELNHPELLEPFNRDFNIQLPLRNKQWEYDSDQYHSFAKEIREFYFGNKNITKSLQELNELLSDVFFAYGTHVAAREQAKLSSANTFYYVFSAERELNFFRKISNATLLSLPGATHADELPYLFRVNAPEYIPNEVYLSLQPESPEALLIKQFAKIFYNFALNGNPSPNSDPIDWKPIQNGTLNFVEFTNDGPIAGVNPNKKRFDFWDNFYKQV